MKIGIDARWIFPEISGIGTYTQELIRGLVQIDRQNEYVLFFDEFYGGLEWGLLFRKRQPWAFLGTLQLWWQPSQHHCRQAVLAYRLDFRNRGLPAFCLRYSCTLSFQNVDNCLSKFATIFLGALQSRHIGSLQIVKYSAKRKQRAIRGTINQSCR